jgi:hypothetical protein
MYNFRVEKCRKYFKENYFNLLRDSGVYFWIAGGCVADNIFDREYRDVDLFFRSKEESQKAIDFCVANYGFDGIKKYNMLEAFLSHRMDTWEFWHYPNFDDLTPTVCIKYFDFTVNACAIDSDLNFYYCEDFFEDNDNRNLVYTGNHYNLSNGRHTTCINRLYRYMQKGFDLKNLDFWVESNAERTDMINGDTHWEPVIETQLNIIVDRYNG